MAKKKQRKDNGIRKIWGVLFIALFIFSLLGLYSYDAGDVSINQVPPNDPIHNFIGLIGAWISYGLLAAFGVGAYLTPLWCLIVGIIMAVDEEDSVWRKVMWATVSVLMLSLSVELNDGMWASVVAKLNLPFTGGFIGYVLMESLLVKWLSVIGAGILLWSVFLVSALLVIGTDNIVRIFWSVISLVSSLSNMVMERYNEGKDKRELIEKRERDLDKERKRLEKNLAKEERQAAREARRKEMDAKRDEAKQEAEKAKLAKQARRERVEPAPKPKKKAAPAERTVTAASGDSTYELPSIDMLEPVVEQAINVDVETTKKIMIETLADFGIEAEVTNVEKGPVVTRYELLPAAGVRVEKIAGLANNLALSLKSHNVRVQAPVPGKGVVGIEVPNISANMVRIRSVLESEDWNPSKLKVPLALGQDVGGNVMIADLAEMPHMLVAGATGAGKTVCTNTMITGLLMSKTPDELRLLLVDPKIVEFAMYNDLPHLVAPVITDPKKVALGLRWAINEMEKRYKLFAKVGVRNIEGYNHREVVTQEDMFDGGSDDAKKAQPPAKIPYIVIIIDELADLMLVDQAGIENNVARLAQLSRAVGIHMILSTQRPSVNVITGTIKANFPARIAFQVAQKTDSRTILDQAGAEKLLGKGDLLFVPPGANKMIRAQGAFTQDDEMKKVVDFVKAQAGPAFDVEIKEKLEKKVIGSVDTGEDDEMLSQAIEIIRETRRASTSSLQRRLRIGYTRAARMIDILEERGMVGPPRGSDPREILIDLDGEIPNNAASEEVISEPEPAESEEETLEVAVEEDSADDFKDDISYVADEDEIIIEDMDERS